MKNNYIYADNAATTQLDKEAYEAMTPFLLEHYANPSQPYSFSRASKNALKEARRTIAECIGAEYEDEIIFTSGGTESDNWAVKICSGDSGDVITSAIEHHAILNACRSLEKHNRKVDYITVDSKGVIDIECLERMISNSTSLVSIMLANNEIGTIQPLQYVSEITREHGCLLHTDAVQAVGHIPVDVTKLGVDLLSASAHKFNGPRGVGFLYKKHNISIAPFIDGGKQEYNLRAGTENVASIVAMSVALKNNCLKIKENEIKLEYLESQLISDLNSYGLDFIINGSKNKLPGNISISFKGCEGESLLHRLDLMGICVSTGSACDSVNTQISHVIKAINVPVEYANGTIRITIGKYNTLEEMRRVAYCLNKIIKG